MSESLVGICSSKSLREARTDLKTYPLQSMFSAHVHCSQHSAINFQIGRLIDVRQYSYSLFDRNYMFVVLCAFFISMLAAQLAVQGLVDESFYTLASHTNADELYRALLPAELPNLRSKSASSSPTQSSPGHWMRFYVFQDVFE